MDNRLSAIGAYAVTGICSFSLLNMQQGHRQLVVSSRYGNPGSGEVLSPTDLVFESPAGLPPQALNVFLLLITTQPGKHLVIIFFL